MLFSSINFLRQELNTFIARKKGAESVYIVFSNLNNILDNPQAADNRLVASISHIEEEKVLKSPDNYTSSNQTITYRQPAVWINVTILFSFFTRSAENYEGIDLLVNVMQYFQSRPVLLRETALMPGNFPNGIEMIRPEIITPSWEQANNLWSLFGGKYQPSVVYRFKSLMIDNQDTEPGGLPVMTTEVKALHRKR